MNPLIHIKNLTVTYSQNVHALANVSCDIYPRDMIAIIGPNGAGKSTLIKAIMGLIQPARGSVIEVDGGTGRLGYVPQHDDVDWSFPVTVEDVVLMGLARKIGWLRHPNRTHRQQVHEALGRVHMADLAGRQIGNLSGGQRRRMFIARALAQQTDVLLLDEPFAGVDVTSESELMEVIEQLNCEGITILLSTHDLQLAFQRFNRVMALNQQLVAMGTAKEIYKPGVLSALYGGAVTTFTPDQENVMLFVDEHHHGCDDDEHSH